MPLQPNQKARVAQAAAAQHFGKQHALAQLAGDAAVVRAGLRQFMIRQATGDMRLADTLQALSRDP